MDKWQGWIRVAAIVGWLALGGVAAGNAQLSSHAPSPTQPNIDAGTDSRIPKVPSEIQERMERQRNDERQKRLVADTDKLLALATSLKQDVDKTDKNMLSVEVVRRTEEIEKLSRAIRERMKQ